MANICEICMRIIEFREEGASIDYEGFVLCSECNEQVETHNEKYTKKSFEKCVEEIRRKKNEKS